MTTIFKVDCRRIFKSLSIFISLAIVVPVTLNMGLRYTLSGFDDAKTFKHMSALTFLLVILGVPFLATVIACGISWWYRLAAITISEEAIQGRNYWGRKNTIPLHDITKLTPFSQNGIRAIVVQSKYHGRIFISDKTERLPELLDFLSGYLPDNQGSKGM